jgi:hypothetical protein
VSSLGREKKDRTYCGSCVFSRRALILASSSSRLIEAGPKMRIEKPEDAKSIVRKYFLGTRTFHEKITSLSVEEKVEGPDDKGAWRVKGTYLTERGAKVRFAATVSPRGEVLATTSSSNKLETPWR